MSVIFVYITDNVELDEKVLLVFLSYYRRVNLVMIPQPNGKLKQFVT